MGRVLCLLLLAQACAAACGCAPPASRADLPQVSGPDLPPAASPGPPAACFGLAPDFSGRLNRQQEAIVPEALRGAFYVESVSDITATELSATLGNKQKEKVADELHAGTKYVALKDYRCVDFGNGVSGMMIVIERRRVVDH